MFVYTCIPEQLRKFWLGETYDNQIKFLKAPYLYPVKKLTIFKM